MARRIGHGVDVESLVVAPGGIDEAVRAARARDLSKVDVLVLVLDQRDDRFSPASAARRIDRLVTPLWQRLTPAASITAVIPPARDGSTDAECRAFGSEVQARTAGSTRVVRLTDGIEGRSPAQRYGSWGDAIAATVTGGLVEPLIWCDPVERLDERPRLLAVGRLGPLDRQWEDAFRPIVTSARQAYGAGSASFSVIGGDDTRYLARQGFDTALVPRKQTICDLALRTYGGVIVGDASDDDRFREFPLVRSGDVRFYAGYRIESPDGQPIGTLCAFDREPRPVLSQDLGILRDFAVSAQRRLWQLGVDSGRALEASEA
jgi:hypothetical protein